ncbi:electron transfer flavoprotein subunit beta/FixA family protein [Endozoicomonas sp. G2_2]|uniref:electron transfer flavoprotein subunit beta/FixA family protein n=1 Tax=Gammaproteobacteria TaxID=1236 RepID=UPI000C3795AB|nr:MULTISPECIES: electron transfer flavoprotein subunit beta/FixA family protein [Gammaproteobacteria]MAS09279.1 EtfB protein [Salinisphaera sp.]MBO9468794.1 electron transfer flavoprotein subunit beta/FixA family protein [Endozoicomonas sp. G2_2]
MKVLVSVKRAIDYNVRIQIKPDGSGVVENGVKHSMNPFDEIAVEQAMKWKESGDAEEVVAVTIGPEAAKEQLRSALAFGCDRAIHVKTDEPVQPLTAARVFEAIAKKEEPKVFLMGKQAIDDDSNQTGQMTSALLEWPQATFASKIELDGDTAKVTREIDAGLETLDIDLPGVITADLRLNEPRYLKLPDIMKAKKKPIEDTSLDDLGVERAAMLETVKTTAPPQRESGEMVDSVDALVSKLKEKGLL